MAAAPESPYAPPAARLAEPVVEERDWNSFSASRRLGIAGCALGIACALTGLVLMVATAVSARLGLGDALFTIAMPALLIAVYAASIASLWPARHLYWLRLLVAALQAILGVIALGMLANLAMELPGELAPHTMRIVPLWLEFGLVPGALCLPPLAYWAAFIGTGQALRRGRAKGAPGKRP